MKPKVQIDDLWRAEQGLPAGDVLYALAGRLASAWNEPSLTSRVKIIYNSRLRTTAGKAFLTLNRVELNLRLLRQHPEQLPVTLAHELAHIVAHWRFGRIEPHGPQFRQLMRLVGMPTAATHRLEVGDLKRRKFLYLHQCSDCGMKFVARSIRRNVFCRRCGPKMQWDIWKFLDCPEGQQELQKRLDAPEQLS